MGLGLIDVGVTIVSYIVLRSSLSRTPKLLYYAVNKSLDLVGKMFPWLSCPSHPINQCLSLPTINSVILEGIECCWFHYTDGNVRPQPFGSLTLKVLGRQPRNICVLCTSIGQPVAAPWHLGLCIQYRLGWVKQVWWGPLGPDILGHLLKTCMLLEGGMGGGETWRALGCCHKHLLSWIPSSRLQQFFLVFA